MVPYYCQSASPGKWSFTNSSEHLCEDSESESHSVMSDSLRPHGLYSPWNSPGQNTGVGSLSLLQGIFPTQGSNPGLPMQVHFCIEMTDRSTVPMSSQKREPVQDSAIIFEGRWVCA